MPEAKNGNLFDYAEIRRLAKKHKPRLIWVGATAYPLKFDYKKFGATPPKLDGDGKELPGLLNELRQIRDEKSEEEAKKKVGN